MLTNKLRVTSLIKKLMGHYVNVAQIHFADNDHQFVKVEQLVREQFVFEPPLKERWFPIYMRKQTEKSRSMFRKHYEETGNKHPECPHERHPALMAWWASPEGISRSGRMRVMNAEKLAQRQSMKAGGEQTTRHALPSLMDTTTIETVTPSVICEPVVTDQLEIRPFPLPDVDMTC
ncbi:hypothetical protein KC19_VG297500 [Ceratodon purpureus]|uniref:Uncharacterized protein n=1 Tax=Ceratodon purpureus TaxID=3225 RepID=A0A8T0HVQ4_CERPU|nr:hypothetical protein KC19_VG297500 [Ceratodon purpureus]